MVTGEAEDTKYKPKLGTYRLSKHRLLYLIYFVAIIVALLLGIVSWQNSKTAFTVNGQRYTTTSYNAFISSAAKHKVTDSIAKTQIISISKDEYVAKKLGITISSGDIFTAARSHFLLAPNATLDNYESLTSWDAALHNYLTLAQSGGYQGAVFFFPFNEHSVETIQGYPKPAGWGDPSAIASDQKYALSQANYYYNKLKAGAINTDNVISAVQANSKLQFSGTSNNSTSFSINTSGFSPINTQTSSTPVSPAILAQIKSFNKVGLTSIETESESYPAFATYNGQTTAFPVDYYFVDLQQVTKADTTIQKTFNQDVESLVVKLNV